MTDLELDEMLTFHWPMVLRRVMAESDQWAQSFAKSIARNAKRANWSPSAKQESIMRRLVSEIGHQVEEDLELIER